MKSFKIYAVFLLMGIIFNFKNAVYSATKDIFQQSMPAKKYYDPASPFLSGSIYKLSWAVVEPREGEFRWETLEKDPRVIATKKRGKKLAVKFQLQGRKEKPSIPSWVKTKIIEGTDAKGEYASWPVFWDKVFLEKFENFLKALAQRYDGDPYIEFFWFDETALGYPRAEKGWIEAGYTDVNIYKDALIEICKDYKKYFKKTPLMHMINKLRRSNEEWLSKHPEDIKAMWEFADFLVPEGIYLGTPAFYESEDDANHGDKRMVWPIFKRYQHSTKIVVLIDRPHAKRIKSPINAIKNLFTSFEVSYLFVDPELIYNNDWKEALNFAKEKLE